MGFAKLCVHIKEAQHTSNALLCVDSVLKVRCGFAAYADRAEWVYTELVNAKKCM